MVRWDSNECLWALSGSQRADTFPTFTVTLIGWPVAVCACLDLRVDTGCLLSQLSVSGSVNYRSLHLFIGWGLSIFHKGQRAKETCVLCVRMCERVSLIYKGHFDS